LAPAAAEAVALLTSERVSEPPAETTNECEKLGHQHTHVILCVCALRCTPPDMCAFCATFSRATCDVAHIIDELKTLVRAHYCAKVLVTNTQPGDLLVLTEQVDHVFNNGRAFVLVNRWRSRPNSILVEVDHTDIDSDSEDDPRILDMCSSTT
jgi:hypothetical protein